MKILCFKIELYNLKLELEPKLELALEPKLQLKLESKLKLKLKRKPELVRVFNTIE